MRDVVGGGLSVNIKHMTLTINLSGDKSICHLPSPCLLLLSTDRHTVEKVVARCFPIQTIKHQAL